MGTPTALLKLIKLILNSVLSYPGAKFACFSVKIFYLATPMDRSVYARIKIKDIPEEFVKEYNLLPMVHNGWIYLEKVRGCYGLPHSGMLANNLLRTRLNKNGYFEGDNHPRSMEASMATHPILFNLGQLWYIICWRTAYPSPPQRPQTTL